MISLKSFSMLACCNSVMAAAWASRRSQLRVSLASLSAIRSLKAKSALLEANCASPALADIEVPDLNICCMTGDKYLGALSCR